MLPRELSDSVLSSRNVCVCSKLSNEGRVIEGVACNFLVDILNDMFFVIEIFLYFVLEQMVLRFKYILWVPSEYDRRWCTKYLVVGVFFDCGFST